MSYAAGNGEFVENIYSVKEQQEIAKKLGIIVDDYPNIPRPVFEKQGRLSGFVDLIHSIFKGKAK